MSSTTMRSHPQILLMVRAIVLSTLALPMVVVRDSRVNQDTRMSFSIAAWARASTKWLLPVPLGPAAGGRRAWSWVPLPFAGAPAQENAELAQHGDEVVHGGGSAPEAVEEAGQVAGDELVGVQQPVLDVGEQPGQFGGFLAAQDRRGGSGGGGAH